MRKTLIILLCLGIACFAYSYDIPQNLFDVDTYVKSLPVEPYQSIISESNIEYARKVESLSPIEKNMSLVIFAGLGEDDVRLSENEQLIPLTASPIEYQCVDLVFIQKNYPAALAVLKKVYAEAIHSPQRRKDIEKAINFTYIVINKSNVNLKKSTLDAYYKKVITEMIAMNVKSNFKNLLPGDARKTISEVIINYYLNPDESSYRELLNLMASFARYNNAPPIVTGNNAVVFTPYRDAMLKTFDGLNGYNDLQWNSDLSDLLNSDKSVHSKAFDSVMKAIISNHTTYTPFKKTKKPYKAIAGYKGEYNNALSLKQGDLVTVLSNEIQGWVLCRKKAGGKGWAPFDNLVYAPEKKKATPTPIPTAVKDNTIVKKNKRQETEAKILEIVDKIVKRKYVYNQRAYINGKTYNMDCFLTVKAVLEYANLTYPNDLHKYGGNGVKKLFYSLRDKKKIHNVKVPKIGDIIFWDNTWDKNKDGYNGNDPLTHTGIVTGVDKDGTVSYLHANYVYGLVIEKMNLYYPNQRKDKNGKEINSFMRPKSDHIPYLAGALCRSFGRVF